MNKINKVIINRFISTWCCLYVQLCFSLQVSWIGEVLWVRLVHQAELSGLTGGGQFQSRGRVDGTALTTIGFEVGAEILVKSVDPQRPGTRHQHRPEDIGLCVCVSKGTYPKLLVNHFVPYHDAKQCHI